MKYDSVGPDITIRYETMEKDISTGHVIHPDLGISINGSPLVSLKEIITSALNNSDLTLKSLKDREAK